VEASALTHASRRGLFVRRSRLLKIQGDERLVALIRAGNDHAFEVLFDRYHARLLAFCHHMLASREDAEDVLQDVFVAAHKAMLGDARRINVRPWLYRIARNRCLNHLRRPVPEGQDSMDVLPHENGASTYEQVKNREEFRRLVADVGTLPETQRTALLLREVDAMSYEDIAQAMGTTVPSVKSLLVRARITLAEASQARLLTCGEVQLDLAEAAEGLRKASGPVRQHVRTCDTCRDFRSQLRSDSRALSALAPVGPLVLLKEAILAKFAGLTGGGSTAGGGAAAGGATAAGGAAGGSALGGAALGAAGMGGAAGGVGGAIGAKAAASVATAAILTAGAVEVNNYVTTDSTAPQAATAQQVAEDPKPQRHEAAAKPEEEPAPAEPSAEAPAVEPDPAATTEEPAVPTAPQPEPEPPAEGSGSGTGGGFTQVTGHVQGHSVGSYTFGSGAVVEAPEDAPSEPPPVEDNPPSDPGAPAP
jgi:RNA polymerase sigma factor (sigma-70 family)